MSVNGRISSRSLPQYCRVRNILGTAAAGRAVVVSPHMENFRELVDELQAACRLAVELASA